MLKNTKTEPDPDRAWPSLQLNIKKFLREEIKRLDV